MTRSRTLVSVVFSALSVTSLAGALMTGCTSRSASTDNGDSAARDSGKPANAGPNDAANGKNAPAVAVQAPDLIDALYSQRILEAARDFKKWECLQAIYQAPSQCAMASPSTALMQSQAKDGEAHGGKVYQLWMTSLVKYRTATYDSEGRRKIIGEEAKARALRGLTVVKDSFHVAEAKDNQDQVGVFEAGDTQSAGYKVSRRGVVLGQPIGQFVMIFVGMDQPGTDEGWVYGTVDARGEVTAAGDVDSCATCHATAPHGRLFGVKNAHVVAKIHDVTGSR